MYLFITILIKLIINICTFYRVHLNDLENIPAFIFIALVYLFTNPISNVFSNLFRFFTISRYLHTVIYAVYVVPQPTRAILFWIGHLIT